MNGNKETLKQLKRLRTQDRFKDVREYTDFAVLTLEFKFENDRDEKGRILRKAIQSPKTIYDSDWALTYMVKEEQVSMLPFLLNQKRRYSNTDAYMVQILDRAILQLKEIEKRQQDSTGTK